MTDQRATHDGGIRSQAAVEFHFRNIGPVKEAHLELGDLTIIAGRNNTGKTYLAYTLYGFLKMWSAWPRAEQALQPADASDHEPNLRKVFERLLREGTARFPIDSDTLAARRDDCLRTISRDFSDDALPVVFSSQGDDFEDASVTVAYNRNEPNIQLTSETFELTKTSVLEVKHEEGHVVLTIDKPGSVPSSRESIFDLSLYYAHFLLKDLLPVPFILSAERFGISLFHRELDFTKNQLVDLLQKMGDDRNRQRFSPFLLIDQATSRYALPIKDNIDYTRSIPDRRKNRSELWDTKLFDEIKRMMDGYYSASGDEIRFVSKARGEGRRFNIPLHLASSSARGLSDLYFFLRHVARRNHLLIIDEPESHLDTANQVELARLLACFVRSGLKVLVTTHSDYLVKEINNLVMLGQEFEDRESVAAKLGYKENDSFDPMSIRAYVAENGGFTRCKVDRFGIDMPVFDETIDSINQAATDLASRLQDGRGP